MSCLSNQKQIATLYVQDYHETFPMAFGNRGTVRGYNANTPAPYNRAAGVSATSRAMGQISYVNALFPYVKNNDVWARPSASPVTSYLDSFKTTQVKPPISVTYEYNGLLQSHSAAGINRTAEVFLIRENMGKVKRVGASFASPFFICDDGTKPCVYQPTGSQCATGNGFGMIALLGSVGCNKWEPAKPGTGA